MFCLLFLNSIFVEKLMEGKVFSAELEPLAENSMSQKSLSVTELEHAISDVRRILEIVWEQVSVICGVLELQCWSPSCPVVII